MMVWRQLGTAATVLVMFCASQANAESEGNDKEIALLKAQLQLMEAKLDKLQKRTSANTNAVAGAKTEEVKRPPVDANVAYPLKVGPSGVVVTMPNNRPTICTADSQNCVAITSRVH